MLMPGLMASDVEKIARMRFPSFVDNLEPGQQFIEVDPRKPIRFTFTGGRQRARGNEVSENDTIALPPGPEPTVVALLDAQPNSTLAIPQNSTEVSLEKSSESASVEVAVEKESVETFPTIEATNVTTTATTTEKSHVPLSEALPTTTTTAGPIDNVMQSLINKLVEAGVDKLPSPNDVELSDTDAPGVDIIPDELFGVPDVVSTTISTTIAPTTTTTATTPTTTTPTTTRSRQRRPGIDVLTVTRRECAMLSSHSKYSFAASPRICSRATAAVDPRDGLIIACGQGDITWQTHHCPDGTTCMRIEESLYRVCC